MNGQFNKLKIVFCSDQPFLVGWVFLCSIWEKSFLVSLADQLFQPD